MASFSPQATADQPTTSPIATPATHTPHTIKHNQPTTRTAPLKGNKQNINRVHIPYITSSLRMNQIFRVLPKLNIFINTPTPFAGPPEANHVKPDSANPTELKGKHSLNQHVQQEIPSIVPTHQHRRSNRKLHSFFAYFGIDTIFNLGTSTNSYMYRKAVNKDISLNTMNTCCF